MSRVMEIVTADTPEAVSKRAYMAFRRIGKVLEYNPAEFVEGRIFVNGWPALLIRLGGEIDSVLSVRVDEGLVSAIYTVRNPEKLSRMMEESTLSR